MIDNSYLWTEGKKTYGAMFGYEDPEGDPRWRVGFQKLVDLLAQGEPVAKVFISGALNLQDNLIWNSLRRRGIDVQVNPCKPDQVDAAFLATTACEAGSLHVAKHLGVEDFTFLHRSRSYVLVTSNPDYVPLVKTLLDMDYNVDVWAWDRCSAQIYQSLTQMYPAHLTIHSLDPFVTFFGYVQNAWKNIRLPPDRTLLVVNYESHSVALRRFMSTVHLPVYVHCVSGNTMAVVIHQREKPTEILDTLVLRLRSLLDNTDDVMSYGQWLGQQLSIQLGCLPETDTTADASHTPGPHEATQDDWQPAPIRHPLKPSKRQRSRGTSRCLWREFCVAGSGCNFGHSKEEEDYFLARDHNLRPVFRSRKVYRCELDICKYSGNMKHMCDYVHGDEPYFCTACATWGTHKVTECVFVDNKRPMISYDQYVLLFPSDLRKVMNKSNL